MTSVQPSLLRPRHVSARSIGQLLLTLEQWGHDASLRTLGAQADLNHSKQVQLSGITLASSRVAPGDLYVALTGANAHGAQFAPEAVQAGARAILTDPAGWSLLTTGPHSMTQLLPEIPLVVVDQPRRVLGQLSAWIYGNAASQLRTIAVTGTNGKTTTSYMLDSCLRQAGWRTGLIGTIETRLGTSGGDIAFASARTTPEAPDLHALFAVMHEQGAQAVVMEVSSHALCLGRVDGIVFDVAVFTNLSQDHLDFHSDMEEYFQAKASLFTPQRARSAVVCVDDSYGQRLAGQTGLPCVTYSAQISPSPASSQQQAQHYPRQVQMSPMGTAVQLSPSSAVHSFELGVPGQFNVANALAAALVCQGLGIDSKAVVEGLQKARVPGRMERVVLTSDSHRQAQSSPETPQEEQQEGYQQNFGILVDYAHTPAAVDTALQAIRATNPARLWCVLGCGGDRDAGKRPLMGKAAMEGADVVVVTDDNPRSEDPAAIRDAVLQGARQVLQARHPGQQEQPGGRTAALLVDIADRAAAIDYAIAGAQPGDVVAILGKGHERGQETSAGVQPFDDRQVAMSSLKRKKATQASGSTPAQPSTTHPSDPAKKEPLP